MKDNAGQTRMIKAKVLSPIRLDRPEDKDNRVLNPGEVVELTEEEAKEFCDREFKTLHNFSGERSMEAATRHVMKRAVRV